MHLSPGDPVKIMLGPRATEEAVNRLRSELHLDQPLFLQYGNWLRNVLKGDWGRSIQLKRNVLPLALDRFSNTVLLALMSIALASAVGILTGSLAAFWRFSIFDRAITFVAITGISIPVFWLGLILQMFFGVILGVLPVSGMTGSGGGLLNTGSHFVLPVIALAAGPTAVIARITRSSLLEVIGMEYIKAARAKGLTEVAVTFKHALKNAFIPVLTVIGMQLGFALAGAVFVENIFSWPGIGKLLVSGILARDFPLVQGSVLLVAFTFAFVNLLVDLLYAYINPSIQYG